MVEYYQRLLEPVFAGRRFILIGGPVAGLTPLGRALRALGAERPFLLGSSPGTGPLATPDEAEWRSLDLRSTDMMSGMWQYEQRLGELPAEITSALDAWDPRREARAVGAILLSDVREVAGRARWARRAPAWAALEDKTRIGEFFDAIGLRRGPSAIARAELSELVRAAAPLDRGLGTVWAGDTRPGIHGGAAFLRWVRDDESARAAAQFFEARCERVRVMPFLEGIPCSIHGIVFPQGAAVFRPMEMLTLRRAGRAELVYAGSASYWDPPSADREAMRAAARSVAEGLAAHVQFRGAFTLDGVLAEDGFVPTELNPRLGAAFRHLAQAEPELPLVPLALAAQAGEPLEYRHGELEKLLLGSADARRSGGPHLVVQRAFAESRTLPLVRESEGYRPAAAGESGDGALVCGPSDVGGFLVYTPASGRVPAGPPYAPEAVRALAAADRLLDAGIGALEPARAVR